MEQALSGWIAACVGYFPDVKSLAAVALDVNSLRGSLDGLARAVHLLSLLDRAAGCVFSQTRVDRMTNEGNMVLPLSKLEFSLSSVRITTGEGGLHEVKGQWFVAA